MAFIGDDVDEDRLLIEPELVGLRAPWLGGELNLKSFAQSDKGVLLLLSAAAAAANGSGLPFHAELLKALSNSVVELEGDAKEANGSLSPEKGSKLSDPFFLRPLFVMVEATANGSSECDVNGSANPTSLNGSSVKSKSA